MKGIKRLYFLLILISSILLQACQMGYLVGEGIKQLQLLAKRRPVKEVLKDPSAGLEAKRKILLVQMVRDFAVLDMGLDGRGTYTSYIRQDSKTVAYMVAAAYKDRLEPYTWYFPFVGSLPYKGFFRLEDAIRERERLDARGLDTILLGIGAFSSLGLFKDPLYSSMLLREDVELIQTVIHELVHRTIYFCDHPEFNERIATFIGWKGCMEFIMAHYGKRSPLYARAEALLHDEELFGEFIQWAYRRLESFYSASLSRTEKIALRVEVFHQILRRFHELSPNFRTDRYSYFPSQPMNNALILIHRTYRLDMELLHRLYKALGEKVWKMVSFLRDIPQDISPRMYIQEWLSSQTLGETSHHALDLSLLSWPSSSSL